MKSISNPEVLIVLLRDLRDLAFLRDQGWYRIPVNSAPRRWPPQWLAFYLPKKFKEQAYSIPYYGRVKAIDEVSRAELFPHELPSPRSEKRYYRLEIEELKALPKPITSAHPRRLLFVPTTWQKFERAAQINDLFDDSPLEDRLWQELQQANISAERQWNVQVKKSIYRLDFAIFCRQGKVDVETDGDSWHQKPERAQADYRRQNDLESAGWHTLRFNSREINEESRQSLYKIQEMINRLEGLRSDGLAPRLFYPQSNAQQLSLFEPPSSYEIEEAEPDWGEE